MALCLNGVAVCCVGLALADDDWLRLVDAPCTELFDTQDAAYKADLLPQDALLVSIEAGVTQGWERYTGLNGLNIGIDRFGASAPAGDLFEKFGLTSEAIVPQILSKLSN